MKSIIGSQSPAAPGFSTPVPKGMGDLEWMLYLGGLSPVPLGPEALAGLVLSQRGLPDLSGCREGQG